MKYYLTLILALIALTLNAQDAKLTINGVEHRGTKVNDGTVDFATANAILVPTETLKKIIADLKYYKVLAHEDSIKIAELTKIIDASEKFENSADTLIKSQKAMLLTADSLYTGYKDLYKDLKRLCDINTFSITPGVGLVNIPDINPQVNLVFNLGFEYHKVNLNALIGKKYQGLTVGYRIRF